MIRRLMLILLALLAFLCVYPIAFLLIGSFTGAAELETYLGPVLDNREGYAVFWLFPYFPTLRSLVELLLDTPEFFRMFWNSVKLTMGILAGQLLVAVPGAWGLAKGRFPGRRMVFLLYILLMMMPFQVLMLSNYLLLDRLWLLDTHLGILLPGIFATFPVFVMYRFFRSVPDALIEAARLDGANSFQIFWYIGIPLGSPGIISVMVLGFLEYWNLIEQPMAFLKSKKLWPLSLYLPGIQMEDAGIAFAASVVALLPAILVFLAGQEYLELGIMTSAMKE